MQPSIYFLFIYLGITKEEVNDKGLKPDEENPIAGKGYKL